MEESMVRAAEDQQQFEQLWQVTEVIFSFCSERTGGVWIQDLRVQRPVTKDSVRTLSGFVLEFYCECPCSLITPWGYWAFAGMSSGNWRTVDSELLRRLDGRRWRRRRQDADGNHVGPWYSLHSIDGVKLPPLEKSPRPLYYTEAKRAAEAWNQFTAEKLPKAEESSEEW